MKKIANSVLALLFIMGSCVGKTLAIPTRIPDSKISQQLNLPIYEWVDKNKPRKGTIVAVHGLTLYAACWDNFAKHLADKGFRVFALDQRGFGRWRNESSKFGSNDKIEIGQSQQDLLDLVTTLKQAYPKQPLFLLGESLGSNMALSLVSDHPELANGAILAALCYKNRIHAKPGHWAKDFAREIIKPNAPLNLTPYSAPYLTNDPVVAKACDADSMINRKMTPEDLVKVDVLNGKAISAAKNLPINFPLYLISGAQDGMFKSQDLPELILKFGTKNISVNLINNKGHLLLEHQPVDPQIAGLIDKWLATQLRSKPASGAAK